MAETEWVRVRDTRTDKILPNLVPRLHLDLVDYLKEVPSAHKKADRVVITEPVQPAAGVPVQEPETSAVGGKATPVTEPAKPEKK